MQKAPWGARAEEKGNDVVDKDVVVARGGFEPKELAAALGFDADVAPSGAWAGAASARVAAYDADFEMYGALGSRAKSLPRDESLPLSETTASPEPAASSTPRPKLVTYPGFDPVTMYDEDDLDPECVFVLLASKHEGDKKKGEKNTFVSYVWIGRGVDDGGDADVFGARVAEECAARVAETFGETHAVRVEREGNESEAFWEHFEAGQE